MANTVQWIGEIWERYQTQLAGILPQMIGILLAVLLLGGLGAFLAPRLLRARPLPERLLHWAPRISMAVAAVAVLVGLYQVVSSASVMDDAYISFRYAENLADGKGLVFNEGEYVEGITNILWTAIISLIYLVTPWDAVIIGLVLSIIAFAANLLVVYRVSQTIAAEHKPRFHLPIALIMTSVQATMVEFGSTGLETSFTNMLVNLGLLYFLKKRTPRNAVLSGAFFTTACFSRPDQALFYFAAGLAMTVQVISDFIQRARLERLDLRRLWQDGLRRLLLFAAPAASYALLMIFRYVYYGALMPNTYYAKSVEGSYWYQGIIYAMTFYLGSHFWLLLVLGIVWLMWRKSSPRIARMKTFFALSFILQNLYTLKVGGDFMYGRFYLTLIPFTFLALEDLVYYTLGQARVRWATGYRYLAVAFAGLLFMTLPKMEIIGPAHIRWFIASEGKVYRVKKWSPFTLEHHCFRAGKLFYEALYKKGFRVPFSTGGIGMIAYYSKQELIDRNGLTDAFVAAHPIQGPRHRPGHEKHGPEWYIQQRGVVITHWPIIPRHANLTHLRLPGGENVNKYGTWHLYKYPAPLMRKIRAASPELGIVDMEAFLDDYIKRMDTVPLDALRKDLADFDQYYFQHNNDKRRRAAILNHLRREEGRARMQAQNPGAGGPPAPASPATPPPPSTK